MTYESEQYLLKEMARDDYMDLYDYDNRLKEVADTTMGFDEDYNIIDDDADMLFPQEIKVYDI